MKKILLLLLLPALLVSCKPFQEQMYVEVGPSETAYVIPLEQGTENQSKLKSLDYLEHNKVVSKRIYVPTQWHQTGRMSRTGQWIPSIRVIKVNRMPVTREWTGSGSGTNANKKEELNVESKESIGFTLGITATASITEEDASKFLYNYNGRTLEQVMDNDIRGFIQNILTTEFGIRVLSQCQSERKIIIETMRTKTTEHFAELGIRIMNIGAAGGFNYTDESIQQSINEKFSSEMKITSANNEVISANKFAQAKNAIVDQKNLDADINIKNAIADGIRSGKLPIPSTLTTAGGNVSMLELYGLKNMGSK